MFFIVFSVFKYLCTVKYNAFGESQSKQHVFSVSVTSVIFRLTPVSLPSHSRHLPSHSRLTPVISRLTPVSLPSSSVSLPSSSVSLPSHSRHLPSHSRLTPVSLPSRFRLTSVSLSVSLPSSSVSLPSHFRGKGQKTTERETEVRRKQDGSETGVRRKVTGVRRE